APLTIQKLNTRDLPLGMQQSTNHVEKIGQAATRATKHYAQVIAIKGSNRAQLLKNASKIPHAPRQHRGYVATPSGPEFAASTPLNDKSLHPMGKPEVP